MTFTRTSLIFYTYLNYLANIMLFRLLLFFTLFISNSAYAKKDTIKLFNKNHKALHVKFTYLTEEEYYIQDAYQYGQPYIRDNQYRMNEFSRHLLNINESSKKKVKPLGLRIRGLTFYYHSDNQTRWKLKVRGNKAAVSYSYKF